MGIDSDAEAGRYVLHAAAADLCYDCGGGSHVLCPAHAKAQAKRVRDFRRGFDLDDDGGEAGRETHEEAAQGA